MFNSYVIKLPEGNIKWTICRCQMMWLYWHYISYSKLKHMNHIHILQLSWLLMPAESHLLSRTCWELDEVFIPIVLMKPPTWSTCFHHRLIISSISSANHVSLRLLQGLNEKVIDGKPGESQIIHEEIDKYPLVNIQKTMENHHF